TCGQCVPCRVGVVRQQEALQRLVQGRPLGSVAGEFKVFCELCPAVGGASISGLGQTPPSAWGTAVPRGGRFSGGALQKPIRCSTRLSLPYLCRRVRFHKWRSP